MENIFVKRSYGKYIRNMRRGWDLITRSSFVTNQKQKTSRMSQGLNLLFCPFKSPKNKQLFFETRANQQTNYQIRVLDSLPGSGIWSPRLVSWLQETVDSSCSKNRICWFAYSNPTRKWSRSLSPFSLRETRVGFEPTNDGFANRSVKPLRHRVLFYF